MVSAPCLGRRLRLRGGRAATRAAMASRTRLAQVRAMAAVFSWLCFGRRWIRLQQWPRLCRIAALDAATAWEPLPIQSCANQPRASEPPSGPCAAQSSTRRFPRPSMDWSVFETTGSPSRERLVTTSHWTATYPTRSLQSTSVRIDHRTHSSPTYIKWRNSWSSPPVPALCCSSLQDASA